MAENTRKHATKQFYVSIAIIFTIILSACSVFEDSPLEDTVFTESIENYARAEVVFQVNLPAPISSTDKLVLEIMDDVTGIYLNPTQYEMAGQDYQNFYINLPLTVGEKVKYRYLRKSGQTFYEYTARNEPLRYREYFVDGPALLQDYVSAWSDYPYTGPVGRIRGQLTEQSSNIPLPNLMINAGGIQTISSADGSFIIEGLPIGTQNVVISSLDGSYDTFQQGAVIAEEATTPIMIEMKKRSTVNVEFMVKMPDGFTTDLPLKLATNLYSLGYPEADLISGSNTISSDLPVFTKNSDSEYTLSLSLPAGTDLRYKFTLGDGFWNSELTSSGGFVTRELVVPSEDTTIQKKVEAFTSPNVGAISINVAVPQTTPGNETVSLQLNSFGWMQPLPMRKIGENQWSYTLYSPTHMVSNIEYRFCRNDQCDMAISKPGETGTITTSNMPQTLTMSFENWQYLSANTGTTNVDTNAGALQPRTDFITGFELISDFPASWKTSVDQGLVSAASTGASWVIVSPTWTITSTNPPLFEPLPGTDLLWPDLQLLIANISSNNLQPVLFPRISNSSEIDAFWVNGKKDGGWWQTIFERYQRFILQNADLAQSLNAAALIVGDPAMRPSMGSGVLSNGGISNAPENADQQWSQLVSDIRARYSGPVIGVISLPDHNNGKFPEWLKNVDAIYVLFSPSLTSSSDQSVQAMVSVFDTALETYVQPLSAQFGKPIVIGIDYPSNPTALNGCITVNGSCMSNETVDFSGQSVDLDMQAKIYNAAIISCARRSWVNGFVSRGYDPLVVMKDQTSSIYGKPASDILWFWFHYILNISI
jgi:hypothetical protein